MSPTADRFRALARSSPWRWRSLHLSRHGDPGGTVVEAWVDRATSSARVRDAAGRTHRLVEPPGGTAVVSFAVSEGSEAASEVLPRVLHVAPHEVAPVLDDDGFVRLRPDVLEDADGRTFTLVDYGDPMFENYQWVAMLDPHELSHHVDLTDVVGGRRRGRETWCATAVPLPGYDPTCGCCPLLDSEVAARDEYDDFDRRWPRGRTFPDSHRVSLDVETGVVVVLAPQGAPSDGRGGWSVEIHEVDGPAPAHL